MTYLSKRMLGGGRWGMGPRRGVSLHGDKSPMFKRKNVRLWMIPTFLNPMYDCFSRIIVVVDSDESDEQCYESSYSSDSDSQRVSSDFDYVWPGHSCIEWSSGRPDHQIHDFSTSCMWSMTEAAWTYMASISKIFWISLRLELQLIYKYLIFPIRLIISIHWK